MDLPGNCIIVDITISAYGRIKCRNLHSDDNNSYLIIDDSDLELDEDTGYNYPMYNKVTPRLNKPYNIYSEEY